MLKASTCWQCGQVWIRPDTPPVKPREELVQAARDLLEAYGARENATALIVAARYQMRHVMEAYGFNYMDQQAAMQEAIRIGRQT